MKMIFGFLPTPAREVLETEKSCARANIAKTGQQRIGPPLSFEFDRQVILVPGLDRVRPGQQDRGLVLIWPLHGNVRDPVRAGNGPVECGVFEERLEGEGSVVPHLAQGGYALFLRGEFNGAPRDGLAVLFQELAADGVGFGGLLRRSSAT